MSAKVIKVLCSQSGSFIRKPILKKVDVSKLQYIPQTHTASTSTLKGICDMLNINTATMSTEKIKQFNELSELMNGAVKQGAKLKFFA